MTGYDYLSTSDYEGDSTIREWRDILGDPDLDIRDINSRGLPKLEWAILDSLKLPKRIE
jgi:hypothetical protein